MWLAHEHFFERDSAVSPLDQRHQNQLFTDSTLQEWHKVPLTPEAKHRIWFYHLAAIQNPNGRYVSKTAYHMLIDYIKICGMARQTI
jgi:hypothetical protein